MARTNDRSRRTKDQYRSALAVRLTREQRDLVEAAAQREMLMASTWARRVLVDAAKQETLRFAGEAAPAAAP